MEKKRIDILNGSIWDKILAFALPLAATSVLQQLFNSADVAVVGYFSGSNALAAVGTCNLVVVFMIYFFIGLSNGSSIVLSQCFGENDEEKVLRNALFSSNIINYFYFCLFAHREHLFL